jgi:hypothetical protein
LNSGLLGKENKGIQTLTNTLVILLHCKMEVKALLLRYFHRPSFYLSLAILGSAENDWSCVHFVLYFWEIIFNLKDKEIFTFF